MARARFRLVHYHLYCRLITLHIPVTLYLMESRICLLDDLLVLQCCVRHLQYPRYPRGISGGQDDYRYPLIFG